MRRLSNRRTRQPGDGSGIRGRAFRSLLVGGAIDDVGTGIASIAITLIALDLTGNALFAGFLGAMGMLLPALWSFPAGWMSDAVPRRLIMTIAPVMSSIAFAVLAVLLISGHLTPLLLVVLDAAAGLATVSYRACSRAVVRDIVSRDSVARAVGQLQARSAVALVIGPGLGGILYAVVPALPIAINSASYLAAIVVVLFFRDKPREAAAVPFSIREMTAGFRTLLGHSVLWRFSVLQMAINVAVTGMVTGMTIALRMESLPSQVVALVPVAFAVGLILGVTLLQSWAERLPIRSLVAVGLLVLAAGLLVACLSPWWGLALIGLCAGSIFLGPLLGISASYQVHVIPEAVRGRSLAADDALTDGVGALGPLASGTLLSATDSRASLGALALLVVSALGWVVSSRRFRSVPSARRLPEAD